MPTVEELEQKLAQMEHKNRQDMGQLLELARQATMQVDPDPDEPIAELRPSQLRSYVEQAAARQIAPVMAAGFKASRVQNKALFKQSTPDFAKYEKEVEALFDQYGENGDQVAAQPGAYERMYHFVRSQHLNEVVEEEVKRRTAPRPTDDEDEPEDEETEEEEETEEVQAQAPPAAKPQSGRVAPPVVARSGAAGIAPKKKAKIAPLTEGEAKVARGLGLTPEEYRAGQNPRYVEDADPFGFRDPVTGKMRDRV